MTSEDEFDTCSLPDIDDDLWDKLQASFVRGSRLPPSAPYRDSSLEGPTEGVEQDGADGQPIIGTQSTFSDGSSFFDSFTESQRALLDQILASSQPPVQAPDSCHSSEGSSDFDIEDIEDMPHAPKPLIQLFRPAGRLSVSDLVQPTWCQLKVEYDLRGLKHLGEGNRKEIFVTAHNKRITIDRKVSTKTAELSEKGRAVHKALEKEIRPMEIPVVTRTREDAWGIKIINMLANLRALQTLDKCRELSVFGFVDGVLVHGTIDEVTREPFPQPRSTLPPSRKRKRGSGPGPQQISFSPPSGKRSSGSRRAPGAVGPTLNRLTFKAPQTMRTHGFYLIDTKTRNSRTTPVEADTLPAMIQLSLYKRLFDLVTSTGSDDGLWDKMFKQEGLKIYQPLSEDFVVQSLLIIETNDMGHMPGILEARCLGELVAVWRKTVEDIGIANVGSEDELTIVYRKNEKTVTAKRKAKKQKLSKANGKGKGKLKPLPVDVDIMEVDQEGASAAAGSSPAEHPPSSECSSDPESDIIGKKVFEYNPDFLNEHVKASLDFWRGIQKAKGVGVEDTRRCNSCEYKEGCEWREEKGLEALKKVKLS